MTHWIHTLADKLDLHITVGATQTWTVERLGRAVKVEVPPLDPNDRIHRIGLASVLHGVRLGLDRKLAEYDVREEYEPPRERPRNIYEAPSLYGRRIPVLLTDVALRWASATAGAEMAAIPWFDNDLKILFQLETGKHLHVLAQSDLAPLPHPLAVIEEHSKYTLFHSGAGRAKPTEVVTVSGGAIDIYRTRLGAASSYSVLFPDLAYDAAASGAYLAIPGRDILLVARPSSSTSDRKSIVESLRSRVNEELGMCPLPFTDAIFEFDQTQLHCLEPSTRLPSIWLNPQVQAVAMNTPTG